MCRGLRLPRSLHFPSTSNVVSATPEPASATTDKPLTVKEEVSRSADTPSTQVGLGLPAWHSMFKLFSKCTSPLGKGFPRRNRCSARFEPKPCTSVSGQFPANTNPARFPDEPHPSTASANSPRFPGRSKIDFDFHTSLQAWHRALLGALAEAKLRYVYASSLSRPTLRVYIDLKTPFSGRSKINFPNLKLVVDYRMLTGAAEALAAPDLPSDPFFGRSNIKFRNLELAAPLAANANQPRFPDTRKSHFQSQGSA
ncbi:hypothetical protein D9611_013162 [Ephemerocybe angulata]|uniref:Uncharacterized protein n=1 Tax=Ephemerocybe angulata TaxID=980116 RepID=A0A8H5BTD6_9AGAR|nr:hypothetical protein D9611_013162 [Tulosesus angulatus]